MWKRETPNSPPSVAKDPSTSLSTTPEREATKVQANIGKSVFIRGELTGSENLAIEGEVEGKIELNDYILTIGQNGRIRAQIHAKSVVVFGSVVGDIIATDRVAIREGGSVEGDIQAPRIAIAEGSSFRGKIDMQAIPATSTSHAPKALGFEAEPESRAYGSRNAAADEALDVDDLDDLLSAEPAKS
jgi:cytoskeletal protein CcmA (bactofilin family)